MILTEYDQLNFLLMSLQLLIVNSTTELQNVNIIYFDFIYINFHYLLKHRNQRRFYINYVVKVKQDTSTI